MKRIPMVGKKYGHLTVITDGPTVKGHHKLLCKCDCGNYVMVDAGNLRSGHTKSCGHCERYIFVPPSSFKCLLPTGDSFLIDASDLAEVQKHKWSIENSGYVHTTINGKHTRLHQFLMRPYQGVVDHINGDRTDNRRSNLRVATNKDNVRNQKIGKRNSSGYKGVSYDSRRGKYAAHITVDRVGRFLGYYDNAVDAAVAYDRAAAIYFGEFARPNFKEVINEEVLEMGEKQDAV